MLKFTWCNDIINHAVQNSALVEEVQLGEYHDLLEANETGLDQDKQFLDFDKFILDNEDS